MIRPRRKKREIECMNLDFEIKREERKERRGAKPLGRGEDKVDYESTEHMSMLTHDNDGKSVSD